jgi:RNase adapter protein RapZ
MTNAIDLAGIELVLITGMSGSGKSVALNALEDAGFYCVDNLPPELLLQLMAVERDHGANRVAIAMDVRSAKSLPLVPDTLNTLQAQGVIVKPFFVDATTDTLVRRYSESRRRHPLSTVKNDTTVAMQDMDVHRALVDAIELERELLAELRNRSHVIDTSLIRSTQLQGYVKRLVASPVDQMTLVFESFAFKRGIPMDADYVFDVRMLPNPHYEPELRLKTGLDDAVQTFLRQHADVALMASHIASFLRSWLVPLAKDHRSYVTVAIGCTGGQHRSVYLVETIAALFREEWITLTRHRELDARERLGDRRSTGH